jgi:hypothetical protein
MAVRFKGDPIPGETGSGKGPESPLNNYISPTTVEMLNGQDGNGQDGPDENVDDDEDEGAKPDYSRERTGVRIGVPMEEAQKVAEIEEALDSEDVVPMIFSKALHLQDKGLMHHWGPGVHMVPVSLAGVQGDKSKPMHWYLRNNKIRRTGKPLPSPNKD